MANKTPNIDGIIKYAKEKTETKKQLVEDTLKKMIKKQMKINFNSVSEESGVSKGFLYKIPDLRDRINTLRKQQEGLSSPKQVKRNMTGASKDVVIASLRRRVNDLEKENRQLREQLKVQFGNMYKEI